jgi:hypothetical protein
MSSYSIETRDIAESSTNLLIWKGIDAKEEIADFLNVLLARGTHIASNGTQYRVSVCIVEYHCAKYK